MSYNLTAARMAGELRRITVPGPYSAALVSVDTSTGGATLTGDASVAATATIGAAGFTAETTGATRTATATITAVGRVVSDWSAPVSGTTQGAAVLGGATLAATATITAAGFPVTFRAATVPGTASIATGGFAARLVGAALVVTATRAAAGLGSWGPPGGIQAVAVSPTRVDVSWNAVPTATAYRVWRDGTVLAAYVNALTYSDLTVQPETGYSYEVASIR
jgi:hypothetical protein